MNNPNGLESLEDVLDAYTASDDGAYTSLDDWIRRYPQYEQELTEFAISWILMEALPPSPDAEEVNEGTLVLRGMSVVQNLLHDQSLESGSVPVPPFESLLSEGRACGLEPRQLAHVARFGVGLLRKLDRRLIYYASIPRDAVRGLAEAIQSGTPIRRSERLGLPAARSSGGACYGTPIRTGTGGRRSRKFL